MAARFPFSYLERPQYSDLESSDVDSSGDSEEELENKKRDPPQNLELFLTGLALKYNVEKEEILNNIITRFFEGAPPNHIWYHYEARNLLC